MRVFVLFVLVLMGCEEERIYTCPDNFEPQYGVRQIWIDSKCSDKAVDAILEGIDDLNQFTENHICQSTLEVVGEIYIDHEKQEISVDVPVIACYDDIPSWWYGSSFEKNNTIGFSSTKHGIRLFLFRRSTVSFGLIHHLILHEALHFIGLHDHHYGNGVMTPLVSNDRSYTKDDLDFFCDSFDCINDY